MRGCVYSIVVAVIACGCATAPEPGATGELARAEVVASAASLVAAGITRVSVVSDGATADLVLNGASGSYAGTLILPMGGHSVVASAFAGETLVGRSRPASVTITAGVVTRMALEILDLRPDAPPLFGPIVDTLTFPTTVNAGASTTFATTAVAPSGDALSYAWSSSCADAVFSAPAAATTSWSKASQGACMITVVVTANGLTAQRSFGIVVFPAGAASGAADITSTFLAKPTVVWSFAPGTMAVSQQNASCDVVAGSNASCQFTLASPDVAAYQATVIDWGGGVAGTLTVADNCGGRFGTAAQDFSDLTGFWLPPVVGGTCLVTATATTLEGVTGTITAAVVSDAGAPPPATQPPSVSALLDVVLSQTMQANIFLGNPTPPPTVIAPGLQMLASASVGWRDGLPGSVTVVDSCTGAQPTKPLFGFDWETSFWITATAPGTLCTVTLTATNLQGVSHSLAAQYRVASP